MPVKRPLDSPKSLRRIVWNSAVQVLLTSYCQKWGAVLEAGIISRVRTFWPVLWPHSTSTMYHYFCLSTPWGALSHERGINAFVAILKVVKLRTRKIKNTKALASLCYSLIQNLGFLNPRSFSIRPATCQPFYFCPIFLPFKTGQIISLQLG